MAIAVVQNTTHSHAAAAGLTCVFGSNITAGNWIFVLVCDKNRTTSTVPTDSLGTTYVADQTFRETAFGSWDACMYRSNAVSAGGANTVTVAKAVSDDINAIAVEVSGLAASPLDLTPAGATGSNFGAGTDNGPATGILSQADEIIFAMITGRSTVQITALGTPSGFTALGTAYLGGTNSIDSAAHFAYQIVSATTSVQPAWISSGGSANVCAMITPTYKSGAVADANTYNISPLFILGMS